MKIHKQFCLASDQLLTKRYSLGEIEYVEVLLAREMDFARCERKIEDLSQLFDLLSH